MFKLIKILNSGVNVPEPQKFNKSASLTVKVGDALIISNGGLASCPATTTPTHVAFSAGKYGESEIFAYEVNENMIFETNVSADPSALMVGDKVTLGKDADGSTVNVTATVTSGVATVVDLMSARQAGDRINVKF